MLFTAVCDFLVTPDWYWSDLRVVLCVLRHLDTLTSGVGSLLISDQVVTSLQLLPVLCDDHETLRVCHIARC